jgi:hypothetical protein
MFRGLTPFFVEVRPLSGSSWLLYPGRIKSLHLLRATTIVDSPSDNVAVSVDDCQSGQDGSELDCELFLRSQFTPCQSLMEKTEADLQTYWELSISRTNELVMLLQ